MASNTPQSFQNHATIVPLFHYVALPILGINVFWSFYDLTQNFGSGAIRAATVAVALVVTALLARVFALGAQDRVIRLEERMRMKALLPDDLTARIEDFTTKQLIALRFAGDAELPALARRVLEDGLSEQKAIKQEIKEWKSDFQRL
jgi:hypothetical protein